MATNIQLETLLNTVVDGIITIDEKGMIEMFNPSAETIFGYTSQEVLGKNVSMLMPEPYHSEHDHYLRCYIETGETKIIGFGREVVGLRKDGSTFPMDLAVSEMFVNGERKFTGIVRDITERKKLETKLRVSMEQLARSNKELDDFSYIVSHDLKEPLRGINNYSQFVLEDHGDKLDEDGRSKLETLVKLAGRLENLINDILYFSRVGRTELGLEATDLEKVFQEILETLKPVLEEKNVEIKKPQNLPVIQCDRVRISNVFQNLITNAITYNDKPEILIEVGFMDPSPEKGNPDPGVPGQKSPHVFYVRDNGIGIREKHFKSIFTIFKRLQHRDHYGGGTGAGLAIVKKIVEQHNGKIWVESTLGEGTTFFFTLEGEL